MIPGRMPNGAQALIRTLVNSLPGLVAPDWIDTRTQPIALADVVSYLVAALVFPLKESRVYEIGGSDTLYRTRP